MGAHIWWKHNATPVHMCRKPWFLLGIPTADFIRCSKYWRKWMGNGCSVMGPNPRIYSTHHLVTLGRLSCHWRVALVAMVLHLIAVTILAGCFGRDPCGVKWPVPGCNLVNSSYVCHGMPIPSCWLWILDGTLSLAPLGAGPKFVSIHPGLRTLRSAGLDANSHAAKNRMT